MLNRFSMLVACALTFALCWVPGFAFAGDAEDGAQVAATAHGLSYGIEGFERLAKGTARAMEGQPEGYRFPVDEDVDLVVVPAADRVVVWISPKAVEKFGLDLQDNECVSGLKALVCELDSANSMGGAQLGDVDLPWYVTAETTFDAGGYTYGFDVRGADGDRYVVIASASGDAKGGARWLDSAQMVEASSVVLRDEQGPLTSRASFLGDIDYRPFWVSIKTSGLALLISFALGLFAAWKTMGTSSRIKGLLDSVFTIPMVLPPTVCGFLLLMLFGRSTGVGQWLIAHGISIVFTWPAAVVSAVVVSFPLVYRTALGAFESLDTQMLDAARTLGWSERRIFTKLMMPLGWPSIAAGTVLAFARAMGEFGCTLFFAGNYAGITQTIPIAIYFEWMGGNTSVALFWVVVVIVFSFLVILFINMYTAHSQKYRERGLSRAERKQAKELAGQGDSLDPVGGDALRIDREALAELMLDDAAPQGGRLAMSLVLDIKKRYPGFMLDMQLEAGEERVALLGASGCGKSCTLRCIAGVETPDEGKIVVNGVTFFDSAAGINLSPQERKCALLFQNYQLFPNMTVADNVCAGVKDAGDAAARKKLAERYLGIFGLADFADRYPARLSGGQQQRVALARMVAAHPGIFMFDEPMSALDSYLKSALEQNMLDLFDVCNRTVLYVSHDIDEACRLCERICVMHNGHMEEIGSVEDVVRRPQTLAALRLTGCKNTSRARKIGDEEVEALDWGMTFNVGREVSDNVAYLGIRASYFHVDNRAERGRNSYDLHVARVSDSRFERLVLLDVPRADAPTRLQWKVNKVRMPVDKLPQAGETLRMHFDASRIHLVCR